MLGLSWNASAIQAQFCNGLAGCNILISLAHKLPFSGSTKDSKCQVSFHLGSGWRLAQRCNTEVASVCTSCRSGWAGRAWLDIRSATGGDAWRPTLALADTGLSTHTCALPRMCTQTHAKRDASIRLDHEAGCTRLLPVPSSLSGGVFHQREKVSGREQTVPQEGIPRVSLNSNGRRQFPFSCLQRCDGGTPASKEHALPTG